ncbi:hypothetical protein [Arcticibacter sp. MXS-1]|uniref:hypothetical protein n=1 Tax=Arcticibacter sp. MXS-1 TaxID=3341726 RepID=UPI0035A8CF00
MSRLGRYFVIVKSALLVATTWPFITMLSFIAPGLTELRMRIIHYHRTAVVRHDIA